MAPASIMRKGKPLGFQSQAIPSRRTRKVNILKIFVVIALTTLILSPRMRRHLYFWKSAGQQHTHPMLEMLNVSPDEQRRLDEVADLMLEIYQTLAEMRYLDVAGIQRGPHDLHRFHGEYRTKGVDDSIIYLWSVLPFVDGNEAGQTDFFPAGRFSYLPEGQWTPARRRDPFLLSPEGGDFNAQHGPYMRPWAAPLSMLPFSSPKDHASVLLYDARQHRIWILDRVDWQSTDPALRGVPNTVNTSANEYSFQHVPSRDAGDVLRDINKWFRALEVFPGGRANSEVGWKDLAWREETLGLRALYKSNGWPRNFDGDAFEVGFARAKCAWLARQLAEESIQSIRELNESRERKWDLPLKKLKEQLAIATDKEEEWSTRYAIWTNEQGLAKLANDIAKATREAAVSCPEGVCQKTEDLPLWEMEMIRVEYGYLDDVEYWRNWTRRSEETGNLDGQLRRYKAKLRHAEKAVAIYQKAYEASKADAERLCPGKRFESATGMTFPRDGDSEKRAQAQWQSGKLEDMRKSIAEIQEWLTLLPGDVKAARQQAEDDIRRQVQYIKDYEW